MATFVRNNRLYAGIVAALGAGSAVYAFSPQVPLWFCSSLRFVVCSLEVLVCSLYLYLIYLASIPGRHAVQVVGGGRGHGAQDRGRLQEAERPRGSQVQVAAEEASHQGVLRLRVL